MAERILDLSGGQLTEVPTDLLGGEEITHLSLADNQLTEVPDSVLELSALRTLDLGGNRLRSLPEQLNRLRHLASLVVDRNELTELPETLRDLTELRGLRAGDNSLRCIPAPVLELPHLGILRLHGNGITSLPEDIGRLGELFDLDLSFNSLDVIPDGIAQLGQLRLLDLSANQLTRLPAPVTRISTLRGLHLAKNGLVELPPDIGALTGLEILDLTGNRLRRLPPELAQLDGSVQLRLDGNPLDEPLPSLLNNETLGPLFTYLRSLENAEPQYEAKLVLIGEGAVGKSSLVAALRDEGFVENRPTTHGIERQRITLPHPSVDTAMTLNAWDFGGQEVYRITHQFFFSERALYLLVWLPRQGQEQNEVEGWLRRIQLRVADATVIVVSTHCEDERNPELDYPGLAARFGSMLAGQLAVDNRSGTGIGELRARIAAAAAELPQMGEPWSARWAAASEELQSLNRPQITLTEFGELCARHGLDHDETGTLSTLLHQLGHIIHYRADDGLRDIVVLQPDWLTKAISYVLEDADTRAAGGLLDHRRLREIWQRDEVSYPAEFHPYFLRLMEKFDVSYRIEGTEQSLVAQLVPYERPELPWQPAHPPPGARQLILLCTMTDEAPGLIAWLTVRNHRFSTGRYWRHGMLLRHEADRAEAMFVRDDPRHLMLTVRGASPDHFFGILRDSLEYLITQRWPGLGHEFHVPCRGVDVGRACPGRFRLDSLRRARERGIATIDCHECFRGWDIAELLTGFPSAHQPVEQQLDQVQRRLDEVAARSSGIAGSVREIRASLGRVEAYTAETADAVRKVLKLTQVEVPDAPRLFTITPEQRGRLGRLRRAVRTTHRLTVWCEQPGALHPWPEASYELTTATDWLRRISPYAALVVKSLRIMLPIAGAIGDAVLGERDREALDYTLTVMGAIVTPGQLAGNAHPDDVLITAAAGIGLTAAQGAGLRALRGFLFSADELRRFGGIRRVQDQTGDILWVCPEHYPIYDPGLPRLPEPD